MSSERRDPSFQCEDRAATDTVWTVSSTAGMATDSITGSLPGKSVNPQGAIGTSDVDGVDAKGVRPTTGSALDQWLSRVAAR